MTPGPIAVGLIRAAGTTQWYDPRMALKAITVKLSRSAYVKVSRVAKSRGLTQSAVIREAIEGLKEPRPQSFLEAAGEAVGSVEGPDDLSTNPARLEGYGL